METLPDIYGRSQACERINEAEIMCKHNKIMNNHTYIEYCTLISILHYYYCEHVLSSHYTPRESRVHHSVSRDTAGLHAAFSPNKPEPQKHLVFLPNPRVARFTRVVLPEISSFTVTTSALFFNVNTHRILSHIYIYIYVCNELLMFSR